jgi:hypothetical protein
MKLIKLSATASGFSSAARRQPGCDAMPCRHQAGMAVDQQHGRTVTTKPHPQPSLAEIDHFVAEAFEHGPDAIVPHSLHAPSSSARIGTNYRGTLVLVGLSRSALPSGDGLSDAGGNRGGGPR